MSIPPISSAAAALRAQIVGQAENELVPGLAKTRPAETRASAQPATHPNPQAPPNDTARAIHTALETAVSRQDGLGGLMADLEQALATGALPPQARSAAAQVLAMRTPITPAPTANDLKQAASSSGVFLEQHVATGAAAAPDLKASLLMLRQMLQVAMAAAPAAPQPKSALASTRHAPSAPPPFRDDAPHGQKAMAARLPTDAPTTEVVRSLERSATAAIARQELFQLASLPDAARTDAIAERNAAWLFEIPFVTPRGTAVAQFQIDKDGGGTGDGGIATPATWRTRFSIDLEPLGPIHVQLVMETGRTLVTLWVEREAALSALRRGQAMLAGEMEAEVAVYPGSPNSAPPRPGRFVDRAT